MRRRRAWNWWATQRYDPVGSPYQGVDEIEEVRPKRGIFKFVDPSFLEFLWVVVILGGGIILFEGVALDAGKSPRCL